MRINPPTGPTIARSNLTSNAFARMTDSPRSAYENAINFAAAHNFAYLNLQVQPSPLYQFDPKFVATLNEQQDVSQYLADMCQFNADLADLQQRFPAGTPVPFLPIPGEPADDTLGDVLNSLGSTAAELSDIVQQIQAALAQGQGGTDAVEHLVREANKKVDYLNQWMTFLQTYLNWTPPMASC
jgi:hypothetical protein